jgi:hypothetical protein
MNGNSTVVTNQSISLDPLRRNEWVISLKIQLLMGVNTFSKMAGFTHEIGVGTTFLFKKGCIYFARESQRAIFDALKNYIICKIKLVGNH